MSLSELYQNAKKDKKDTQERVVYLQSHSELSKDLDQIKTSITELKDGFIRLEQATSRLEALKMPEFNEKHARMKEAYNKLVICTTAHQTETNAVVLDISKRLNDIEARLSL